MKNQVVHVRGDSDSELQALFDHVLKPDSDGNPMTQRPKQVPWTSRNLPASFFRPPNTGTRSPSVSSVSHSRESSADSTTHNLPPHHQQQQQGPPPPHHAHHHHVHSPHIHHPRAHSSPASLQQTYAAARLANSGELPNAHARQHSYDALDDGLGPLPPGWQKAVTSTGQVYFLE
jgi:protein yorkie